MRKWTLRLRTDDKKTFLALRSGKKSIETRAATERYRKIKTGDVLVFTCGKARTAKLVKRARRFSSIEVMLRVVNYKKIMPAVASISKIKKVYYSYPGYREKIKKFGLVALYI